MSTLAAETIAAETLLGNMSARPRTSVTRTVPAIRTSWAAFGPMPRVPRLTAELRRDLDDAWRRLAFTGAFIVHLESAVNCDDLEVTRCGDDLLVLNVLLRTRGSLLLAGAPLLTDTAALAKVTILCDDPRLVEAIR